MYRDAAVTDPELGPAVPTGLPPGMVTGLLRRVAASGAGGTATTTAPFTGARPADVSVSSADDVGAAAHRARAAQREWAARPVAERAAVLLAFHDRVLDRQADVLDLIQLECGRSQLSAFEEVADVAQLARHYGRLATTGLGLGRVYAAPADRLARRTTGVLRALKAVGRA